MDRIKDPISSTGYLQPNYTKHLNQILSDKVVMNLNLSCSNQNFHPLFPSTIITKY